MSLREFMMNTDGHGFKKASLGGRKELLDGVLVSTPASAARASWRVNGSSLSAKSFSTLNAACRQNSERTVNP